MTIPKVITSRDLFPAGSSPKKIFYPEYYKQGYEEIERHYQEKILQDYYYYQSSYSKFFQQQYLDQVVYGPLKYLQTNLDWDWPTETKPAKPKSDQQLALDSLNQFSDLMQANHSNCCITLPALQYACPQNDQT